MAETWSKLTPLDSAAASEGPARIRFIKTAMATLLAVEHTFTTGALTLTHNLSYAATEPTAGTANRWFYDSATGQIKRDTGTAWEAITPPKGLFVAGTKTIFCQAAAPTGWTKDATYNDKMLRVVSTAGGGTGGAAAFTSSAGSHTHAVVSKELIVEHSAWPVSFAYNTGTKNIYAHNQVNEHNYSHPHDDMTAYSHTHTSDGTFRPQYVDIIVCTKS